MSLRIRTLKLKAIRQFRDVTLDFTDPKTGKPLDRICLIGGNGTGKSTILRLLAADSILGVPSAAPPWIKKLAASAAMFVEFEHGDTSACLQGNPNTNNRLPGRLAWKTR
jgi:hypothetical protein